MAWLAPVIGAVAPTVIGGIESLFGGGQSPPSPDSAGDFASAPWSQAAAGVTNAALTQAQANNNLATVNNLVDNAANQVNSATDARANQYLGLLSQMSNPALQGGITPAQVNATGGVTPMTTTSPLERYFSTSNGNSYSPSSPFSAALTAANTPSLQLRTPTANGGIVAPTTASSASGTTKSTQPVSTLSPSQLQSLISGVVDTSVKSMGSQFDAGTLDTSIYDQLANGGQLTPGQMAALSNGFNASEPHGASFVEENKNGGNTVGFENSWTKNLMNALNNYDDSMAGTGASS